MNTGLAGGFIQSPRSQAQERTRAHSGADGRYDYWSDPHRSAHGRTTGGQVRRNLDAPRPRIQTQVPA